MAPKKYKGRKAYLNDFKLNEKGEYAYEGILYEWTGEKEGYRRTLRALLGLGIIQLMVLVAAGCIEAPGAMDYFYVILPYMVSLVSGISVIWGIWQLMAGKMPLRAYIYKATVEKIPVRSLIVIISGAAAIVGELYYLLKNGSGGKISGVLTFLFLEGMAVFSSILVVKIIQKMPWQRLEK